MLKNKGESDAASFKNSKECNEKIACKTLYLLFCDFVLFHTKKGG
jgi:hypothetical protein